MPQPTFEHIIPRLDGENHKGQHGKVSVIGGCQEFTGAPFYAAFSAMQAGADYGNIFCTASAATAIKSYAPELIVHPCMLESRELRSTWEDVGIDEDTFRKAAQQAMTGLSASIEKSSCLVIGPGLGKDPIMRHTCAQAIHAARAGGVPIVIDADALGIVADNPDLVRGYARAILTPNAPEFWRLAEALQIDHGKQQPHDAPDIVKQVAQALDGPVLVAKGRRDTVCWDGTLRYSSSVGCPRRCGGQGDILSGVLATTVSWAMAYSRRQKYDQASEEPLAIVESVLAAANVVRQAAQVAFEKRGRSTVARDIMDCLQGVVAERWHM